MSVVRKVALLVNPSRRYTRGLLSGIARFARLRGFWAFYRPLEYREPTARGDLIRALETLQPDGIFLREPVELSQIMKMGIPIVSFSYSKESIEGVVSVGADHTSVGRMGAEHFLERGFQHFAYCGFDDWWWSRRRRDGFCQTIKGAGYPVHVYQSSTQHKQPWCQELPSVAKWLASLPQPVGVLACNDDRGELVVEACKTAGILVPSQVAVVGVDDDHLICDLCHPPLSSIALNLEKSGYASAACLDCLMNGQSYPGDRITIEPTHVVTRQSTDILAVQDAEVSAAIHFIRHHAKRNIRVVDVVNHVSLSRRVLEKRFRTFLGNSIYEEIRRARVGLLIRMLNETQMSVSEIAQALSFDDVTHLSRYFRRAKGISPLQFRKQNIWH